MDEKMAKGLRMTLGDVDNERAKDTSAPGGGQNYQQGVSYQHVQVDAERGYTRSGSPLFYSLLHEMADTHDKKSHDYASDKNPFGNYHFAGQLALLFTHSPEDAGFVGRLGEKIFRLANLDGSGKTPKNETVDDTERDIAVIATLWMADRRERRMAKFNAVAKLMRKAEDQYERDLHLSIESERVAEEILRMLPRLTKDHAEKLAEVIKQQAGRADLSERKG